MPIGQTIHAVILADGLLLLTYMKVHHVARF